MRRRRLEYKTDYKQRLNILKAGKPRFVFRKTNKYIAGQFVESKAAQDRVLLQANSKELLELGWPKELAGSLKSLAACYLTGLLLGKRVKERYGEQEGILDIGLIRNKAKSRIYAFVKGVADSGADIRFKENMLPSEERVRGEHMKKGVDGFLSKIVKNIENE